MAELKKLTQYAICPFWAAQSRQCIICKEGLFIPSDDHVTIYCTSDNYNKCVHYSLRPSNQVDMINAAHYQAKRNRRKYLRIEAKHKITLMKEFNAVNFSQQEIPIHGQTVDLSAGGMRLVTDLPLLNDSLIQFSFDESFPEELQLGTGQIAWCNKLIDMPGYQSGIIFQSNQVMQAMNNYLMVNH